MSKLDNEIAKLYITSSIVNRAFQQTSDETEALKLAVVSMAESLETLENKLLKNELEKPRKFSWEFFGDLTICPECLKIKKQADNDNIIDEVEINLSGLNATFSELEE